MNKKMDAKAVRKIFRKMRLGLGLSQIALGKSAGLSSDKLARWEKGQAKFNDEEMERLGKALDVQLAVRAEGTPGPLTSSDSKALKWLRRAYGITQEKLARRVGLTQTDVSLFENGYTTLSPEEISKVEKAIDSLRVEQGAKPFMQLSSLLGTQPANKPVLSDLLSAGKVTEAHTYKDYLSSLAPPTNEEMTRQRDKIIALQTEQIEGYRKITKTNNEIIALLKEADPGKTAAENAALLEQIEKKDAEIAALREWLNAEEVAATTHDKAAELRERVSIPGMRKENAEGGDE
jgi:transcriptional regulator with XRE-family HTH domain